MRLGEARLSAAVDLAALAFFEADWGTGTVFVDDRFRDLCGVPPDLTGPPILAFWREHLHPDDAPWLLEERRRAHAASRRRSMPSTGIDIRAAARSGFARSAGRPSGTPMARW